MEIVEVELKNFVYGGDAMGRLADGRAVFIPYALPGERVRARIIEEKRGFARAVLAEVLTPSPDRIQPRCAHFGVCGGCQLQHLRYERQLEVKSSVLAEQLIRIGGIAQPPMRPLVPSPDPWHYRNAVQFHITPNGQLGFLRSGSHEIIPIHECHLMQGGLNELWSQLVFEPGSGIQRVDLRLGGEDDLLVILESDEPQPPEFEIDLPVSAVHLSKAGRVVLAGDDHLLIDVLGRTFHVSAESFFQVNTVMAEVMISHLQTILPIPPNATVMDVYSGVGLFSAFLAPCASRLAAIELSPSACLDYALNLDEFDQVELYEGAAEEILPELKLHADAVVVDPPRSGLERPVLDALIQLAPPALAYVSCDAATLARDARRLIAASYRLDQVTPFDLFPQTYAVESISLFTK